MVTMMSILDTEHNMTETRTRGVLQQQLCCVNTRSSEGEGHHNPAQQQQHNNDNTVSCCGSVCHVSRATRPCHTSHTCHTVTQLSPSHDMETRARPLLALATLLAAAGTEAAR